MILAHLLPDSTTANDLTFKWFILEIIMLIRYSEDGGSEVDSTIQQSKIDLQI